MAEMQRSGAGDWKAADWTRSSSEAGAETGAKGFCSCEFCSCAPSFGGPGIAERPFSPRPLGMAEAEVIGKLLVAGVGGASA